MNPLLSYSFSPLYYGTSSILFPFSASSTLNLNKPYNGILTVNIKSLPIHAENLSPIVSNLSLWGGGGSGTSIAGGGGAYCTGSYTFYCGQQLPLVIGSGGVSGSNQPNGQNTTISDGENILAVAGGGSSIGGQAISILTASLVNHASGSRSGGWSSSYGHNIGCGGISSGSNGGFIIHRHFKPLVSA